MNNLKILHNMVDHSEESKNIHINIQMNEEIHKENINSESENIDNLINSIADRLNVDYDFVKDIIVKKMINDNSIDSTDRRNNVISAIQSSVNLSVDKSLMTERLMKNTTLSLDKKNYCMIHLFSEYI